MKRLLLLFTLAVPLLTTGPARAELPAQEELLAGKLGAAEKLLTGKLAAAPDDDAVRFELGLVQLLRGVEKVGGSLFRHGFRFGEAVPLLGVRLRLGAAAPSNPKPEKLSHEGFRAIVRTWVDDLARVEATLAGIKSTQFKLPLPLGKIKVDVLGIGQPLSAAALLRGADEKDLAEQADKFLITFDRGDVHWLRGYGHLLAALGELVLALDVQELFECTGHFFFTNVDTPHTFLREDNPKPYDRDIWRWHPPEILDAITLFHLTLRVPVKEPKRMEAVRQHLLGMIAQGREMWKHILAETDDDHEWIPNPRQTSVVGVRVSQEMIDNWLATLDEAEQVLEGKKLLPFWRGKEMVAYWEEMYKGKPAELPWLSRKTTERGLNLKEVFTNPPREVDVIRWVQGTAATPYLRPGPLTELANLRTMRRLDQVFGGFNFFGFALWFN
jgi:hypothetical protein